MINFQTLFSDNTQEIHSMGNQQRQGSTQGGFSGVQQGPYNQQGQWRTHPGNQFNKYQSGPSNRPIQQGPNCGSNVFQSYFDDAKESRVKQIPKIQESSFKNQDSRFKNHVSRIKIPESREDSIKISTKFFFQNIEYHKKFSQNHYQRLFLSGNRLLEGNNRLPVF